MALGVAAAFAAAVLYNLAVVLWRSEARHIYADGLRLLIALSKRPIWLLGILSWLLGFGAQTFALTHAPISVVQPVIGAGIVLVVAFAALILGERPGSRELIGIAVAVAGVTLLLLTLGEETTMQPISVELLVLVLASLGVGVALSLGLSRARALTGSVAAAVFVGLASGIAQGASDSMNRLMGAWLTGSGGAAGAWVPPPALGVCALLLLFAFGAVGFAIMQTGLRDHRATSVVPPMQIATMLIPIAVAAFVYGQTLPSGALAAALRVLAITLIVIGIIVLSTSPQIAATFTDEPDAERETQNA